MGRRCQEAHCLQYIPDHLFESHRDQHFAEHLAAEEFEHYNSVQHGGSQFAQVLASSSGISVDEDYQLALSLNRDFRKEEEELSFRSVQVRWPYCLTNPNQKSEVGVESQEEEERRSKSQRMDDPRRPTQMLLGPGLVPVQNLSLSNETKGTMKRFQDLTSRPYSRTSTGPESEF